MPNELEQLIASSCPMALGEFISLALTHIKHGYYINRDPFGAGGDFTTAPEISQMFGELIGAWVIDIWMQMGKPPSFNLIEAGAGRGTLMADIMRISGVAKNFAEAAQINLIETSPLLKEKQAVVLNKYNVTWHETVSDVSVDKPCIILGNEFIDALPIEQLRRGSNGWQKRVIDVDDNNKLLFNWVNAQNDLIKLLPSKTVSGEIYEVSPERNNFINECEKLLKPYGGAALFVDYGYIKSHYGDTLQAVKNHGFVNVLEDIGNCDITSHVDFDALSRNSNINVTRVVTQGAWLKSLGIEHRAKAIGANEADLNRLIGAEKMGDLFKVICFYQGDSLMPAGF